MDRRQKMTARDIVNDYTEADLYRVIRDYGEDKFAKNIAKHIVQARAMKPVETTAELSEIIRASIPMKFQKNVWTSCKEDVSGNTHRVEQRT